MITLVQMHLRSQTAKSNFHKMNLNDFKILKLKMAKRILLNL